MRFMMLVIPKDYEKAAPDASPDAKVVAQMMRYNEDLAKTGVLLSLDGLKPPSAGVRVSFTGGKPKVIDGPFAESKEWVGGFWIFELPDLDAALQWATEASKACAGKVEVRPFQPEPPAA